MPALSQVQINTLKAITDDGNGHYWEGYTYLRSILESDPDSSDLVYWLTKGAEINADSSTSQANAFIRGVTRAGFLYRGIPTFDVQYNSDLIGANVIKDILRNGQIPSVDVLVGKDASSAVTDGGQTTGGWGGAFYYWNMMLGSGQTVGQTILADRMLYDEFVSASAKTTVDVISKFGITAEQLWTGLQAQVPATVQAAILARIAAVASGAAPSYAGDPENIDGYTPVYDNNHTVTGWVILTTGEPLTDPTKIAELNLRRENRIRLADDPAFASPNPDNGLNSDSAIQAMLRDSKELNSVLATSPNSFVGSAVGQADLAELAVWYADRLRLTETPAGDEGTFGILTPQGAGSKILEISFSDDVAAVIDHQGNNSLGESTTLTAGQKIAPKILALETVYDALAAASDPSADMKSTLNKAIKSVWEGTADASHIAADKLQYYAFEAANGGGVQLEAHVSQSSALIGGNGADTLNGGNADDILIGGGGADVITGGNGIDIIFGGEGEDVIYAGIDATTDVENDIISAGSGKDIVFAGAGTDIISLGAGDDSATIAVAKDGDGFSVVYGGAGIDTIELTTGSGANGLVYLLDIQGVNDRTFNDLDVNKIKSFVMAHLPGGGEQGTDYDGIVVIINPSKEDKLKYNGKLIGDPQSFTTLTTVRDGGASDLNPNTPGGARGNDERRVDPSNHLKMVGNGQSLDGIAAFFTDAWNVSHIVENQYGLQLNDIRYVLDTQYMNDGDDYYLQNLLYLQGIQFQSTTQQWTQNNYDGSTNVSQTQTFTGDLGALYLAGFNLNDFGVSFSHHGDVSSDLKVSSTLYNVAEWEKATETVSQGIPDITGQKPKELGNVIETNDYPVSENHGLVSDSMLGEDRNRRSHSFAEFATGVLFDGILGGSQFAGTGLDDTITYSTATSGVSLSLATGLGTGGAAAGDVLVSIENVIGSGFADSLTGGASSNVIEGGRGDDVLTGLSGDDTYIYDKGDGADVINETGTDGGTSDQLYFSDLTASSVALRRQGQDLVINVPAAGGGAAEITVTGQFDGILGHGIEEIAFADGVIWNALAITQHTDLGPSGPNIINGTPGDDFLLGTDGDDAIYGGDGNDTMYGGLGNDVIDGQGGGYDQANYYGSASDYTFTRNADGSVTVANATYGTDTLSNIDALYFIDENAVYSLADLAPESPGTGGSNIINGTAGDDFLLGTDGNDAIYGGDGNDTMYGGLGNDLIDGQGGGYDQANYYGSASDYTFTRNADGSVTVANATYGTDTLSSIDGVYFIDENAVYSLADLAPESPGTGGTNIINGTAGDDFLLGTDGNDAIYGGDGNDTMYGGLGNDVIDGQGGGYDQANYYGSASDYTFTRNADGSVTVANATYGTDTLANIDSLYFIDENAVYSLADLAPALNNITGTASGDTLAGSTSADEIFGNDGDDTLTGGLGNDYLEGGVGNDTYKFNFGDGKDIIFDNGAATSEADILVFGAGISASGITITADANGSDLLLTVGGGGDSILLKNQLNNGAGGVDQITFADNTNWDRSAINNHIAA